MASLLGVLDPRTDTINVMVCDHNVTFDFEKPRTSGPFSVGPTAVATIKFGQIERLLVTTHREGTRRARRCTLSTTRPDRCDIGRS